MNAMDLPRYSQNVSSFHSKLLPVLLLLFFLTAAVLKGNAQSANLDQGGNGSSTAPTSPVDWVNGNLNNNQAHFLEGYSVPYRAVLTNLVANKTYTLVIGLDITASGKHALDYITQFQRLEPHGIFLHTAETVDPLLNITGFPKSYFTSTSTLPIPAPSSAGSPVTGQPTTSFNALPASERVMTGYNATLNSVVYASEGSLTGSNSETVINITFTALKETAVLAWGGHIASVLDWGKDASGQTNSASSINGSPYHMRLKNWIIDGNVVSIGNQDRSLKTNAVYIPPEGSISGPSAGCIETTSLNYTSTVDDPTGLTYLWSIIGSNTANAKIVNNTLANIQVVPIGTTFTAGSFSLQLIVTRNGLADTSYLGSDVYPGQVITLSKVTVNAGADQSITNLDTAYLSASASGGVAPYTFSWSPVTGLSNPNIFNPQFIPTGTGTFQFVVTATDSAGCVGKDTVVITVTQHPAPPCIINGPTPVCPGSSNVYMGPLPSQVGSYSWSITGDGSITGAMSNDTVTVMAGNTCGSYTLQLITTTPDGKVKDTCSLVVNVKDTIAPVLSGTAPDATITCAKDVPAAPVITATDNCIGNVQVQMSQQTIDSTCVNKFKLVRKWWAVDACGNTSDTLKQTITVNDNVKPVITADFPKDVKVQCVGDIPAPPAPTATDNCDALVTPVYDEMGSGTACDSTLVRTWIFADACGNSDSVKQTIHIKDSIAPVLSGTAPDASISCAKDIPAAPVITASDNCTDNVTVQMSQMTTDSTCVNKFKLVRKWWAVDACGNTSDTLTQTITVNDNVKPVITADFPKDVKVQCVKDIPAAPTPTATDNCDASVVPAYSEMGSGTACDSTIVRTWIFADACGNSDSVKQTIHIKDSIAPVLSGTAPDASISCAKDIPAAPVITASDNCTDNVTVQMSQMTTDSTCVNKFKLVRKWWAVDACGNTSDTLTQTITVNDNVKPVITADFPKDVKVQCVKDIPAAPTPTATDNCDASVVPAYSEMGSGSACDSTIVRTWIFADACGNSDSVKQTIHIKDSIAPVLSGTAPDAAITCAKDIPAPPVITASDNCTANVAVQMNQMTTDSTCVNKFKLVRKWWAIDACGNSSDTITQTITVNDNVKPVITANFTDVNIQCIKDIPPVPTPTATDNCDASVTPVYSQVGSGTSCDSTIVRTWIFADVCGNSDSVKQTIHIKNNVVPVLSGTASDLVVACAKDVPAPPTITANGSCSGATVYFSAVTTDSTCVNKFTIVRKWWAVDGCGNKSDTIKQTIIVKDSIAPVVATAQGSDKLISCSAPLVYDAPTFTDNCNGKVTVTTSDRKEGTVCPFKYIRRWTATDECGNSIYVEQAITVSCCVSYCTYTQGFYGNKGGVGCTPGGGSLKAQQMMSQVVDAQPGDSAIFGLKSTGKFFTLFLNDITNGTIFNMLPGGGTPAALKGYATYSKSATWPNVPISTASTTFGKINDVLLSQTMTLFFNMGITPTLSALTIGGDSLFTAKLTTCGSSTPVSRIDAYKLPVNVVAYLSSTGQATVQGLFMLANKYLGGQTVSGVSASDVNAAVDAINNGFNNCAVLVRWAKTVSTISNISSVSYDNSGQANYTKEVAPANLSVTVFPNPYTETIFFRYVAPETGKAQLELYNLQGSRVAVIYSGEVTKGSLQLIEYHVPETSRILFIYRLSVGHFNATGKIVPAQ
ncbi:hypothetical protein [Chitinophaga sp. Ak27]|uniref:HYR-like domain-containing protein n=1 Tax=Chitinophaga sp. Ak27 TaxID=2726116 RepID=UPI00145D91B9|nr:hypothetical protein [Chitinophaga sp. Ak27]NLU92454.1 hypothetical protein [Chitinophaga sp. Ak27]